MSKIDTYDRADNYFSIIPQWVLFADISPQAIRLYAVLRTYADNKTNDAYPSRASLANDIKVNSARTVDSALKELVQIGAIRVQNRATESGNQTSNLYTLISTPPVKVGAQNSATPLAIDCETPSEILRTNYNHLTITKELKETDPNGSTVRDLVKLYFDNLPAGNLKPTGRMIAGQIQNAMKTINPDLLKKLIITVAEDGMPLTPNTLMIAHKTISEPPVKPTWTPPAFDREEENRKRSNSTPMPENVRELVKGIRNNLPS